jgi:serralysin
MRVFPRTLRGPEMLRRRRGQRHASNVLRPVLQDLEIRCLLSSADPYEPTAAEQYMLELINQVRANPAAAGQQFVALAQSDPVIAAATSTEDLNQFLQVIDGYGPEPPLAFNTGLIEAALDHDNAMLAANGQFHSPPGYLNNPQVATDANGQAFFPTGATGWATGENIFAYSANLPASSSDAAYVNYFNDAFFLDWGNPDFGHLKNLLAPGPAEATPGSAPFSQIGIGLLTGATPTTQPDPNNPIPTNLGLNVGPDIITQEFGWNGGNAFLTGVVYVDNAPTHLYLPGEGLGSVTIQAVGQNGQGTFQTQTWDSGGYSLALPPGTYSVEASGGGLSAVQTTTITIGKDNVPWNIPVPAAAAAGTPSAGNSTGAGGSSSGSPLLTVAPISEPARTAGVVTIQSAHVVKESHKHTPHHGPTTFFRPAHGRPRETIFAEHSVATPHSSR